MTVSGVRSADGAGDETREKNGEIRVYECVYEYGTSGRIQDLVLLHLLVHPDLLICERKLTRTVGCLVPSSFPPETRNPTPTRSGHEHARKTRVCRIVVRRSSLRCLRRPIPEGQPPPGCACPRLGRRAQRAGKCCPCPAVLHPVHFQDDTVGSPVPCPPRGCVKKLFAGPDAPYGAHYKRARESLPARVCRQARSAEGGCASGGRGCAS